MAALSNGAVEMNPIANVLINTHLFGISLAWPTKIGVCSLALFLASRDVYESPLLRLSTAWFVVGIYTLVVVLNVLVYIQGVI